MNLSDPFTYSFIFVTLEITLVIAILTTVISRTKKQPPRAKNPHLNNPQTNVPAPIKRVQQLESERVALRHELWKHKSEPSVTVVYGLLLSGIISLIASIVYLSSILAFIGLGLTFWGALLVFIKPTKYVKASLLDSTAISSLMAIDKIVAYLNYSGKAIYLPPKYLKALKSGTVFIPAEKDLIIPPAEEVAEEKLFLKNPQGICLTPPGLDLANLYENKLGKDFAKVNLNYLQNNLPKLFIEDLEIAKNFEMNKKNDTIQVKITGSIYRNFCKEARRLSNVCNSFGCPLCSSIAIALTRATGKPIIIEKTDLTKDKNTIEVYYQIIEE